MKMYVVIETIYVMFCAIILSISQPLHHHICCDWNKLCYVLCNNFVNLSALHDHICCDWKIYVMFYAMILSICPPLHDHICCDWNNLHCFMQSFCQFFSPSLPCMLWLKQVMSYFVQSLCQYVNLFMTMHAVTETNYVIFYPITATVMLLLVLADARL